MKASVVIPAAGIGKRFSATGKKQFHTVHGKTVLEYTFEALLRAWDFESFVVGAAHEDFEYIEELAKGAGVPNLILSDGGKERADTVMKALGKVQTAYVAVHDAVRPFITSEIISPLMEAAFQAGGAICALPVRDTVKLVQNEHITATVPRQQVYLAHTPQVFHTETLINAMGLAASNGLTCTDEASAYEAAGLSVRVTPSHQDNIKLTEAADIALIEHLVKKYFYE